MRIAYFTNQYARASDTFIRNEVHELRARGHVVKTFSIRRAIESRPPSADVAAERDATCYILSMPRMRLAATIVGTALRRPVRVVRAFAIAMRMSPDGIRPRMLHAFYWLEALFLAAELRRHDIEILHNHIAENSATVALLASDICGVPFSMTVHGPGIFAHPEASALREKIARAAFTACISDFCRSQCMLYARRDDWPRLKVIRCGVGRAFEDVALTPPPAEPRLLFVGRLCDEKGLPLLLEAVARRVEAGDRCRLSIIGDGPLKPYVESFVAERRLGASIELLGWCGTDDIVAALVASRALVLPSFAEGLPVVIMEAMALGRPVVSTAIAGIPELVVPGVNGWLVPAGSVDALARAIGEVVAAGTDELARMGAAGRRAVLERHSMATEVGRLEEQLAAVVARAAAVPLHDARPIALASTPDPH